MKIVFLIGKKEYLSVDFLDLVIFLARRSKKINHSKTEWKRLFADGAIKLFLKPTDEEYVRS